MTETDFYDYVTQGPRSNPKKALTLHRSGDDLLYLLSGEVIAIEKIVSTLNGHDTVRTKVHVMGNSFIVKESAEDVLRLLQWQIGTL